MHQVSFYLCALRHPVQPQSQVAIVNMIMLNLNIHRTVELNCRHFCPIKKAANMNIMDRIPLYDAERTTHASHNTRLLTIGDFVIADNMTTHCSLVPSKSERAVYSSDITFGRFGTLVIEFISILT